MKKHHTRSEETGNSMDRRSAVRKVLAGAGVVAGSQALPEHWTKPALSTAVIPAHATISENIISFMQAEFEEGGSGTEVVFAAEIANVLPSGEYEAEVNVTSSNRSIGTLILPESEGDLESNGFVWENITVSTGGSLEFDGDPSGADITVEILSESGSLGQASTTVET